MKVITHKRPINQQIDPDDLRDDRYDPTDDHMTVYGYYSDDKDEMRYRLQY